MSNWFTDQRQAWIAEMIRVYGFINRGHIVRKFGVSIPQASIDLTAFRKSNPSVVEYDASQKLYRSTDGHHRLERPRSRRAPS